MSGMYAIDSFVVVLLLHLLQFIPRRFTWSGAILLHYTTALIAATVAAVAVVYVVVARALVVDRSSCIRFFVRALHSQFWLFPAVYLAVFLSPLSHGLRFQFSCTFCYPLVRYFHRPCANGFSPSSSTTIDLSLQIRGVSSLLFFDFSCSLTSRLEMRTVVFFFVRVHCTKSKQINRPLHHK